MGSVVADVKMAPRFDFGRGIGVPLMNNYLTHPLFQTDLLSSLTLFLSNFLIEPGSVGN